MKKKRWKQGVPEWRSAFILHFDTPLQVSGDETTTQFSLRFDRMTVNE